MSCSTFSDLSVAIEVEQADVSIVNKNHPDHPADNMLMQDQLDVMPR